MTGTDKLGLANDHSAGVGMFDNDTHVDLIPTVDDEEPRASYKEWKPEDTKIVVYRIGNDDYPGIYAVSRRAAVSDAIRKHGKIIEANYVRGRAFFRVQRVK